MKKNANLMFRNGCWYANYRVKVKDALGNVKTLQRFVSTRQTDRRIAQAVANKMREDDWAVYNGVLIDRRVPLRDISGTVAQLLKVFREQRTELRAAHRVEEAFLAVLSEGTDTPNKEDVRKLYLNRLNEAIVQRFREQVFRKAVYKKTKDEGVKPRKDVTVNSVMRMAKSIFSARAMEAYQAAGLKLPQTAIDSFMGVSFLPQRKDAMTYRAPAGEIWAAMDASICIMRRLSRWHFAGKNGRRGREWLNAYMTYRIMRRWGLRNSEVEALRWDWFTHRNDGKVWLELIDRGYWKPKGKSRSFAVDKDFVDELRKLSPPPSPKAHVLAGTLTDRQRGAYYCIADFVRRFVSEEEQQKSAYILRKQFGSELLAKGMGIENVSYYLGHSSISVTESHYTDILKMNSLAPL